MAGYESLPGQMASADAGNVFPMQSFGCTDSLEGTPKGTGVSGGVQGPTPTPNQRNKNLIP